MKNATPMSRAELLELVNQQTVTNVENLARAVGRSEMSLYTEIKAGTWKGTRVLRSGRSIKIPTADILALVDNPAAADALAAS